MPTEKEFYNEHHKKVYAFNHPCAFKDGRVYEHRLEVEKDIGQYLLPTEQVHHHYLSKGGYFLAVCRNHIEHNEMHTYEEAFRYSGHWDWRKCVYCKQYDNPNNLSNNSQGVYHKLCNNDYKIRQKVAA